jgi:TatD DNase family protein
VHYELSIIMIDTHSHIYSEDFNTDRDEVIQRAKKAGVTHIILPNIDSASLPDMLALQTQYPGYCFATIGIHPTSIKEDYQNELSMVRAELRLNNYIAIGEIGIDLYWDKTFLSHQIKAFQQQIEWALEYNLPVIIHVRDSFRETMNALAPYKNSGLKGVFHSFTGTMDEAEEIIEFGGFYLGINGIVTFKNSGLAAVIAGIDIKHILLETDSPYLTPTPHRGKRNESAYVQLVAKKLAEIYQCDLPEIITRTTQNAYTLFPGLNK